MLLSGVISISQICAAIEGHVWVTGHDVTSSQINVYGLCFHLSPCVNMWSLFWPEFTLMPMNPPGFILMFKFHAATEDQNDSVVLMFMANIAAGSHIDVSGLHCPLRPW